VRRPPLRRALVLVGEPSYEYDAELDRYDEALYEYDAPSSAPASRRTCTTRR
jgi:hypothetical protein